MNKTAVVSGASRGIGLAIAQMLAIKGYNLVLSARKISEDILALQEKYGDKVRFVSANIASSDDRRKIVDVANCFGDVDLLVNCAGVAPLNRKDMLEISETDYDYVMDINLKGSFFLTQSIGEIMRKNKSGRIVNIGSISADAVSVNRAEYCISKAGIRMMTQLFAMRLAAENIGVFEISPGVIDTDMIAVVKEKYLALASDGLIPTKRLGLPSDVAKAVEAIADGMLDYATGTVIRCDGGLHILSL